jgi:hypothetical protein
LRTTELARLRHRKSSELKPSIRAKSDGQPSPMYWEQPRLAWKGLGIARAERSAKEKEK